MKLKEQIFNARLAKYHGEFIIVPIHTKYMTTDAAGVVKAHVQKPKLKHAWFSKYPDHVEVATVDLEGMNWKESLQEV